MGMAQSVQDGLADTRSRLRFMMAEKSRISERARSNVFEYLLENKFELARIEADDWVQKDCCLAAFELLDKMCEKLSQEIPDMLGRTETSLTRSQMEFGGSIIWAASRFKNELPELQRVADLLMEIFESSRDGGWGANSELAYFVNCSTEPSLSMVMQRLLDSTTNMGDEERDIARLGIENCMASYAAGAPIDVSPATPSRPSTARPSTASSRRLTSRSLSVVMPPPYEHYKV